jgi:hypothetical protein
MADTSGEQDIRGIDIDKLAKGFADLEPNPIQSTITTATTTAREIRWYQKTAGFLDTPDTTGITATGISPHAEGSLPQIAEQSWTRRTSYVKEFMLESPLITDQDIKDTDVDILGTNVRDITRGVQRKVGIRIYSILTDAAAATPTIPLTNGAVTVQNTAATDGWDQSATANPIKDLLVGQRKFRQKGYQPIGSNVGMNSLEHEFLIDYLINTKGSSIPSFSSAQIAKGVVMEILNSNIIVDEIFTNDYVIQWGREAVRWKGFTPITAVKIIEPLIGVKIRVRQEGEAILENPNFVHVISDTTG